MKKVFFMLRISSFFLRFHLVSRCIIDSYVRNVDLLLRDLQKMSLFLYINKVGEGASGSEKRSPFITTICITNF